MVVSMELLPLILLSPILLAAGYCDLRYMRIPNVLSLTAIALFILTTPLIAWPELGARTLAALIVLTLGLVAFAVRILGGGDVKLLAALMLFVPSQSYFLFSLCFSVSMLIGVLFILTLRAAPWWNDVDWVAIRSVGTFPMGISIAMSGLAHPILINALAVH